MIKSMIPITIIHVIIVNSVPEALESPRERHMITYNCIWQYQLFNEATRPALLRDTRCFYKFDTKAFVCSFFVLLALRSEINPCEYFTRIKRILCPFYGKGVGENHLKTPPTHGAAEGIIRLLLTKNPACSFSIPLTGTRYLVWTVPAALQDSWSGIWPLQLYHNYFLA